MPLTEGQLRSKRDEFWDTAPAFDGRKEIWDALRAATNAAEELNFEMAQAILDGANISVPNGYVCNKVVHHYFVNLIIHSYAWVIKESDLSRLISSFYYVANYKR